MDGEELTGLDGQITCLRFICCSQNDHRCHKHGYSFVGETVKLIVYIRNTDVRHLTKKKTTKKQTTQ